MRPAAILDIGSSKIVCLCGSTAVRGGTVVHGAGVCAYAGYESGEFLDIKSLDEAIVSAIRDAEEMSRPDVVIVGMLAIGIIGTAIDYIFLLLMRRIFPWQQAWQR